jgi:heptosyltransferase II
MKILVRATNWVGDAIMSIPALKALRARWADAEIVVLARPWVGALYQGQGFADRVLVFDSDPRGRERFNGQPAASSLSEERFDVALLFPNSFASAWLSWRAGIPERIGYARDGRTILLTKAIPVPRAGELPAHESYYYLELLRRAEWVKSLNTADATEIRLRIEPGAIASAQSKLSAAGARFGKPWLAFAPGAAYGSAKCWPADRFSELADRLIAEFDADVILFGTASERDIAERIAARMRHRPVNLAGQTPIGELPALFAACRLFIGNDSGAMHVAAASGLPVVAIFGSTDPEGTAPVTPRRTIVRRPVSCSPCFLRQCPVDHRCMTRVEVDAVHAAAQDWLERSTRG